MKVAIIIFLMLAIAGIPGITYAQNTTLDTSTKTIDFTNVEIHLNAVTKHPEFSGGKKAWQDFLRSNINVGVPFSNKAKPGTYRIMIRFIIGRDGKLRGIGADTNYGFGMESEVIRCIHKSSDWIPAETKSGTKVSFTMRTIVTFVVKQNDIVVSFQ